MYEGIEGSISEALEKPGLPVVCGQEERQKRWRDSCVSSLQRTDPFDRTLNRHHATNLQASITRSFPEKCHLCDAFDQYV
jgi:hypothetical protein